MGLDTSGTTCSGSTKASQGAVRLDWASAGPIYLSSSTSPAITAGDRMNGYIDFFKLSGNVWLVSSNVWRDSNPLYDIRLSGTITFPSTTYTLGLRTSAAGSGTIYMVNL